MILPLKEFTDFLNFKKEAIWLYFKQDFIFVINKKIFASNRKIFQQLDEIQTKLCIWILFS